ncbi:MAG: TraB/GumN family protein [Paludibacteraceae bacterium]|nr:TraB/GumN family protein [Paludibacteraceae bacterium]
MKHSFITYLLVVVSACACIHTHAQVLYEISGNSTLEKSYLLATNKLINITFIDTIPNVFNSFSKCDKVITEFAFEDYQAIAALRKASLLPDSIQLGAFYTEEEMTKINQELLLTLGMGLQELGRMKPAYLTELYRTELLKKWLHWDESNSMETFFEQVAQQQDIPIYPLDDLGETLYMLFDREPFQWQCKELKKVIDYPDQEVEQERIIRDLYSMGRLNDIAFQVLSPDNATSISYSDYQVYAQRNQQWVKKLKSYLHDGKCFITLNAIYLGGDKGLIAQLKNAGYRIKPVNKRYIPIK